MSILRYHVANRHGHSLVDRIKRSRHPAVEEFEIVIRWIPGDAYPKGRITADGGVDGLVEVGHKTVRLTLRLGMVAAAFEERISKGVSDFLQEVTR